MKFKNTILAHKKMFIASIAALLLGVSISHSNLISQGEYNKLISQSEIINSEIENIKNDVTNQKKELSNTLKEKERLEIEFNDIQKQKEIATKEQIEQAKKEEDNLNKLENEVIVTEETTGGNQNNLVNKAPSESINNTTPIGQMVWVTATGSKYHSRSNCGKSTHVSQVSLATAESRGLTPCKKCY